MLFAIRDVEGRKGILASTHVIKNPKDLRQQFLFKMTVNNFTELLISLTFAVPIAQEDGGGEEKIWPLVINEKEKLALSG